MADNDRSQLQQVVLNLVRNAIEAMSDSNATSRLFDPFVTTKAHGTGLGLAISRTIVKSRQGSLEFEPKVPNGACFKVRLPLANG